MTPPHHTFPPHRFTKDDFMFSFEVTDATAVREGATGDEGYIHPAGVCVCVCVLACLGRTRLHGEGGNVGRVKECWVGSAGGGYRGFPAGLILPDMRDCQRRRALFEFILWHTGGRL